MVCGTITYFCGQKIQVAAGYHKSKQHAKACCLLLCYLIFTSLPWPRVSKLAGDGAGAERPLRGMQRNGATQAQGVEGRRPCANAQRPCAQSRDRFLTFCLLCLYGWPAMGQYHSVNSYILAHIVAHPKGATARGGAAERKRS